MLYYEYNKDDADDTIKLAVKDLSALRFIETNAFVLREHYIGASISADLYDPTEEERPAPTSMSITIRFSEGGYVVTGNGQFKGSGGDMTYNGKLTSPQ
ncbi:MAG UNVERIFIED_CONTAM: DUF3574 domain-containing protein [Planctomycetaceae bacterium]